MDTITHGIVGALVGKAFFTEDVAAALRRHDDADGRDGSASLATGEPAPTWRGPAPTPPAGQRSALQLQGRVAIWAATLAGVFPDFDSVFELFDSSDLAILEWHRGFTHSFLCMPLFALALAGVTRGVARRARWTCPSFGRLTLIYAASLACHILFDLVTSFGTMIWSPLSKARAAWDMTFIIDFTLTGIVLLPQVAAWVYRRASGSFTRRLLAWTLSSVAVLGVERLTRAVGVPFSPWAVVVAAVLLAGLFFLPAWNERGFRIARAKWCRAGFVLMLVYLGLCFAAHRVALARVECFAAERQLQVENLGALPLPPSMLRWNGLIRTPEGVHQAWFHLRDPQAPAFRFFADSPANQYTATARELPAVQRYLWFARFPLVRHVEKNGTQVVEFTDLRFFARRGQEALGFTFRVTFDASGRVLAAGWVD